MKSTFLVCVIAIVIFFFSDINHATEGIKFSYVGKNGPSFWNLLTPESEICVTGKKQSPIDITSDDLMMLATPPEPKFENALNVESTNNGNTVEISSGNEEQPLPAEITIDGEKYTLQQFHFHTPSEHRINGVHKDIEQHLVFKNSYEQISVVAVFYNAGDKVSKFMEPIIKNLPKNVGDKKEIKEVELSSLLCDIKNITEAYTYSGSLTTPPCTEGVTWYVNKDTQPVSHEQFSKLREITGFNSRFTQLRETVSDVDTGVPTDLVNSEETTTSEEITTYKKRSNLYSRSHFKRYNSL